MGLKIQSAKIVVQNISMMSIKKNKFMEVQMKKKEVIAVVCPIKEISMFTLISNITATLATTGSFFKKTKGESEEVRLMREDIKLSLQYCFELGKRVRGTGQKRRTV